MNKLKGVAIGIRFVWLAGTSLIGFPAIAADAPQAVQAQSVITTPLMRSWSKSAGQMRLTARSRVVISPKDAGRLGQDAGTVAFQLESLTHRRWAVATGKPAAGDIVLRIGKTAKASPEGYTLSIANNVTITAPETAGVFYGAQSLLQLLAQDKGSRSLQKGFAVDYPEFPVRAVMIDVGRRYTSVPALQALMREMAWKKMNTLHLHFSDWPAFRLRSDKYPGLAAKESYGREDIAALERTAALYHITIIPEIDLPAHAQAIINFRPSLGFDCPSMRQSPWLAKQHIDQTGKAWTVDITKTQNVEWVKGLLNEFIPWFKGPYFHIGGDEYQYDVDKVQCPELMTAAKAKGLQYPGDVFVDWINQTNEIVKSHGKKTVIWNWWRFRDDKTSIQPAKDILIEVWNQDMQQAIIADGYDTILTPENALYVTPGDEGNHPDDYGIFFTQKVYETFPFDHAPGVKGYMISLWADDSERHSDQYVPGKAYEPINVMAAQLWSGRQTDSVWDLFDRVDAVGTPPGSRPTQSNY